MRFFKVLSACVFTLTLFGCATTNISPQERAALKRIRVEMVAGSDKPFVYAPGYGVAFLLAGPLGVAITQGKTDLPTAYQQLLEQNGIDILAGFNSELKSQLGLKGVELVESPAQADAVMKITYSHGLLGRVLTTDNRVPLLTAEVKLVKPSGEIIWKGPDYVRLWDEIDKRVQARPIPDYFNDPKLLASDIRKANGALAADIAHAF